MKCVTITPSERSCPGQKSNNHFHYHLAATLTSRIPWVSCSFTFTIKIKTVTSNMAGTKISFISNTSVSSNKDKSAKRYKRTCQIPYASFLSDLQRDSDEEEIFMEPGAMTIFPFRSGASFTRFIVNHWSNSFR